MKNYKILITEEQYNFLKENLEITQSIINVTTPEEIRKYSKDVWNIVNAAYVNIGGFKGFRSIKDMLTRDISFSLFEKDGSVCACAIYNGYLGGHKLIGCGAKDNTSENKSFLKDIIKRDINEYSQWYWTEVSPPLEYWFKHLDGWAIPNIYAKEILNKNNLILDPDGLHYTRGIGTDATPTRKAIYGFKDEETFFKVTNEYENYDGFREKVNLLMEVTNDNYLNYFKNIVINMVNLWDDGFLEMTKLHHSLLTKAVSVLENEPVKDQQIKSLIKEGHFLLENMPILSIGGQIDTEKISVDLVENIFKRL